MGLLDKVNRAGLASGIILIVIFVIWATSQYNMAVEKPKKIGFLIADDLRLAQINGVKTGLPRYGLEEGKNVEFIIKNAQGNTSLLPQLAQELLSEKVDLLVTPGSFETMAAKALTKDNPLPVVFIGVGCSVEMGIVQDTINSGCNITGVDSHYIQLSGKRLEFLKRIDPTIKRVSILYNPDSTPIGPSMVYLYDAAAKFDIAFELIPTSTNEQLFAYMDGISKKQTDAILLQCSLLFEKVSNRLALIGIEKGLPIMGVSEQQTASGLLASYGATYYEEGLQASRMIANVLRGQDPQTIPIESPARLEFHLNMDTAKKLNLQLNPADLSFVTHFIGEKPRKEGGS